MILLFASAIAAPIQVDLDGDGKPETVRYDSNSNKVHIGEHTVECPGDPCELEAHDVSSANPSREVEVCGHGPRDTQTCELYTISGSKLAKYAFPEDTWPPEIRTSGNGLVLVVDGWRQRLYERVEKYKASGTRLTEVKQPIYTAPEPKKMKIDRTFPLLFAPDSTSVVANARPDSTIDVLGEHGEKDGWMLVRLSSGISGWVHFDTLGKSSDAYMAVLGAG